MGGQAPQQQNPLNMLAQILQFQQGMQRNKLLELQMQHEQAKQPFEIQKLQAEAAAAPVRAETLRAQQLKAQSSSSGARPAKL